MLDDLLFVLLKIFKKGIFDLGVLGHVKFILLAIEFEAILIVKLDVVVGEKIFHCVNFLRIFLF